MTPITRRRLPVRAGGSTIVPMSRFAILVVLLAALFVGCTTSPSSSGAGSLKACDPLAAVEQPIALGKILGVGRDAVGTLYVVDQSGADYRVYVSSQGALYRQRIAGSGIEGTTRYVFSVTDHDPEFTLEVTTDGGTTRMGVVTGPFDGKSFVIGQDGEELQVVAADTLAGVPLHNLPGDVVVEYTAQLPDQRVMVVTRPHDDWSYEDFRLFLGADGALDERHVGKVTRALDGGSTTIEFVLDGDNAVASFPVVFDGTTFQPGQATLAIGSTTSDLTRLAAPPGDASYRCL